jgi:hypothetical protein
VLRNARSTKAAANLDRSGLRFTRDLLRANGREETRHGERVARVAEILTSGA